GARGGVGDLPHATVLPHTAARDGGRRAHRWGRGVDRLLARRAPARAPRARDARALLVHRCVEELPLAAHRHALARAARGGGRDRELPRTVLRELAVPDGRGGDGARAGADRLPHRAALLRPRNSADGTAIASRGPSH